MVSVIITTHNRKALLERAIESVKKQTFTDYECLIIDDASDDGTNSYLNQLPNSCFKKIIIPKAESRGGNYARNLGIKSSTGNYIAFLDDDDIWEPQKLELQVDFLETHHDIGLVYCQISHDYVRDGYVKKIIPNCSYRGNMSEKIFTCMPCVTSTIMVRREILDRVGLFDEKLKFWQDYDLCIRICQVTKIDYVKKYLVIINDDSGDKQRLTNQLYEWIDAVKYQNRKYRNLIHTLSAETRKARKLLIYNDAVLRCTNSGNMRARRYYLRLIWMETSKKEDFYNFILNRR